GGDFRGIVGRMQLLRAGEPYVAAHQRAHDQEGAAHVGPAVADKGVGDAVIVLVAGLVHGEEVGEHLRGVPLVGQPVVHRHAGVGGEFFDVGLAAAAVLDRVVHAAKDRGGGGDAF